MNSLAPTLQSFFTDWRLRQRWLSVSTPSPRDTFRLLLALAQQATGRVPSQLDWHDLDAPLIAACFEHLETERRNSIRTRSALVTPDWPRSTHFSALRRYATRNLLR